jgi:hypothetical protein
MKFKKIRSSVDPIGNFGENWSSPKNFKDRIDSSAGSLFLAFG